MVVFRYDKTFEGLLTAIFDAYFRKTFPDKLLGRDDIEPLFAEDVFNVITQTDKAERVWKSLKKNMLQNERNMLTYVWLSEVEGSDELLFQYIRKSIDSKRSIGADFGDDTVLKIRNLALKVNKEKHRLIELVRFQKAADDVYFAPLSPDHNCVSLVISHFKDRFADQKWILYDTKRGYGFYYDLQRVTEITLEAPSLLADGKLDEALMAEDEQKFQQLWKAYYKSMTIKERINPQLHNRLLPKRYWKYLTEKQ